MLLFYNNNIKLVSGVFSYVRPGIFYPANALELLHQRIQVRWVNLNGQGGACRMLVCSEQSAAERWQGCLYLLPHFFYVSDLQGYRGHFR